MTPLLALLVIVQTGLGYLGRDSADALAVHVPLGVLIFGIASLLTNVAFAGHSLRQQTAENDV